MSRGRATEAWIFDLDGTLVESRLRLYGAYVEVAGEFGLPVLSPSELRTAIHERSLEARLGLDRPTAEVVLAAWYAAFGANTPASPPFVGAADALRACSRTGARIAIATARPIPASAVSAELHEVGLGQFVDVISTTESVGGPPEPSDQSGTVIEGYLTKKRQIAAALEELEASSSCAAMVSDEAFDLIEAADLGVARLIGVLGGNSGHADFAGADVQVLDSVADLPSVLGVSGWPLRLGPAVARYRHE